MKTRSIVDAYCCVGPFPTRQPPQPYKFEELLVEHGRFRIKRRVCMHAESRDGAQNEGNVEMSHLAELNSGTAVIWTVLPPKRFLAEPIGSLMARAREEGVAMFALLPTRQLHFIAPWANGELYEAMSEVKLPLFLDYPQQEVGEIYEVAKRYPDMPIVIWNAHYRTDRFLIPVMDECQNVHVGLANRFIQADGIECFSGRYGPGRLIYGSSWPAQSPGPLMSYVTYANVDDETKNAILSGNIRRLMDAVEWNVKGFEGANDDSV